MKLSPNHRRALNVLAEAGAYGIPELVLVKMHGFTVDVLAALVRAGYAHVTPDKVWAVGRKMEVMRVQITDAGRRAMEN